MPIKLSLSQALSSLTLVILPHPTGRGRERAAAWARAGGWG